MKQIPLSDERASFLPPVRPECVCCGIVNTVGEYVRLLRNGVAHMNLTFSSVNGEMSGVTFQNKRDGKVTHTFEFSVENLEAFANEFPNLCLNSDASDGQ